MKPQRILSRIFAALFIFMLLGVHPSFAQSGQILVAAASSMRFAFDDLVRVFHQKHPDTQARISFGSSGNFYSQIKNGAPYDVYFSANMDYPLRLESERWGYEDHKVIHYASGKIVLWSPKNSGIDVIREKMRALLSTKTLRIAIANPAHAPYGRAAVEALKHFSIFEDVKQRLVMGENITQATQFAHTGAAQAGIIALSLALTDKMKSAGAHWEIPASAYTPLRQGYLILKNAKNPMAAKIFADFVSGSAGSEILKRHGFDLPQETP